MGICELMYCTQNKHSISSTNFTSTSKQVLFDDNKCYTILQQRTAHTTIGHLISISSSGFVIHVKLAVSPKVALNRCIRQMKYHKANPDIRDHTRWLWLSKPICILIRTFQIRFHTCNTFNRSQTSSNQILCIYYELVNGECNLITMRLP